MHTTILAVLKILGNASPFMYYHTATSTIRMSPNGSFNFEDENYIGYLVDSAGLAINH